MTDEVPMMDEAATHVETEAVPAVDTRPGDAPPTSTVESNAMVPVSLPRDKRGAKVSFWRRLAPRAARRTPESNEALSTQLGALASQLAAAEKLV